MKQYIGTKQVSATPMTKAEYNEYRNWDLSEDEDGTEEGYLVEYEDSNPNHPNHKGYISWSPKKQFDDAYNSINEMTFGHAVVLAMNGHKVARKGWNGKDMWIIFTPGRTVQNLEPNSFYEKSGFIPPVTINGHFDMKAADGSMVVGWLASQTDIVARDWTVVV